MSNNIREEVVNDNSDEDISKDSVIELLSCEKENNERAYGLFYIKYNTYAFRKVVLLVLVKIVDRLFD